MSDQEQPAEAAVAPAAETAAAAENVGRQYADPSRGNRRVLQGLVVSSIQDKTLVVTIERKFKHKRYHKFIRRNSKIYVHDEKNEANKGDLVQVVECRPMSKLKRFRLGAVLKRGGEDQ